MIGEYLNYLKKQINEGNIIEFDEIVHDLEKTKELEEKYSSLSTFFNNLLSFSSDQEIYSEIQFFLEFLNRVGVDYLTFYGYNKGILEEIVITLKSALELKEDELKNKIKELIEKISLVNQGYGLPKEECKNDNTKEEVVKNSENSSVNLFDQEICQAGDYGPNGKVTVEDLDKIVKNFYLLKEKVKVPLTIDHIQEGPSYGFITHLRRVGDKIYADIEYVDESLADAIKQKRYQRYSPEIYITKPIGVTEEVEPPILKALSILGVKQPAMKGLKDAEVVYNCENGLNYLLYSEEESMEKEKLLEEIKNLQKEKVKLEVQKFAEEMMREGKIIPATKQLAEDILVSLGTGEQFVSFSENDKIENISLYEAFKKYISASNRIVEFSEIKKEEDIPDDPELALDLAVEKLIKETKEKSGRILTYAEALEIIQKSFLKEQTK